MLYKTKGIILHNIKYSETSIICKVFTRELGLQSYMVNGVRTAKAASKASLFRPVNFLDLVVYHKDRQGLQRIKEYQNGLIYRSLPFNIIKSSLAMFMVEVLNKVIVGEQPNVELFDYLEQAFTELDSLELIDNNFHLYFLLRLSLYLGFTPSGQYDSEYRYFDLKEGCFTNTTIIDKQFVLLEPYSQYLSQLLDENVPVAINNIERQQLLDYLLRYFAYHLNGFGNLQSHKVLHDVLEG